MDILKRAYRQVLSLRDYLKAVLPEESISKLLHHPKKGFPLFLSKTLVAMVTWSPPDRREVPLVTSDHIDQMQVVEEIIQELLSSGRTADVLTYGLHRKTGSSPSLSFHPDHNYPQLITPYWTNLLQIIGVKNMKDLLLNTSIFIAVSSSYIQISGLPVHMVIGKGSSFVPQPPPSSNREKGKASRESQVETDGPVSAVNFCYDKTWHRKLSKTHPLNMLQASNKGALELVKLIFPKQNVRDGKREAKRKINRVPKRLIRSKNLLRQLLANFKKTPLRVHHPRLNQNPSIKKLFQTGQSTQEQFTIESVSLEKPDKSVSLAASTSRPCKEPDRLEGFSEVLSCTERKCAESARKTTLHGNSLCPSQSQPMKASLSKGHPASWESDAVEERQRTTSSRDSSQSLEETSLQDQQMKGVVHAVTSDGVQAGGEMKLDNSTFSSCRDRSFELFSSSESEKQDDAHEGRSEQGDDHSGIRSHTNERTGVMAGREGEETGLSMHPAQGGSRETSDFSSESETQGSSKQRINQRLDLFHSRHQVSMVTESSIGDASATRRSSKQRTTSETGRMKRSLYFRRRILQRIRRNGLIRKFDYNQYYLGYPNRLKREFADRSLDQKQMLIQEGRKRKRSLASQCKSLLPAKKARLELATNRVHDRRNGLVGAPDAQSHENPEVVRDRASTTRQDKNHNKNLITRSSVRYRTKLKMSNSKTSSRFSNGSTIQEDEKGRAPSPHEYSPLKDARSNWRRKTSLSNGFSSESPLSMGLTGLEVYVPLRALLKRIIPIELWGSTANQNAFFRYVKELLKLGRFEKLPLSLMIRSLKVADCQWASVTDESTNHSPRTDRVKKHELVVAMFTWLVTDLLVPLVRTLYYVTETSMSKNELIYYPKHLWRKLQEKAISDYEKVGVVKCVDKEYVSHLIMTQKTLGKSKLRFIPKEKGFRPIVRMGKSTLRDKKKFGINFLLNDLLDVLNYLRTSHPELYGSSLLGITSIYSKWKEFVLQRKVNHDTRPLYFVKVDISKCYDSIPHSKMPVVMATLLKEKSLPQSYLLQRYMVTTQTGMGEVNKRSLRRVSPGDTGQDPRKAFHQTLVDLLHEGKHRNSVLCNQASSHLESVDSLLSRLHQLVKYDIVSIGNTEFLRTRGISQGSVLSSLLCSIFYSHLENGYLVGIGQDGLLLRLIDDFLLVTPYLSSATRFLNVLFARDCAGQFGCEINPLKTLTNFKFEYNGRQLDRALDGDWFPWCGFLFNTKTLEVKNDYQRYISTSFRYSMTLSFVAMDVLGSMKKKLIQALHRSKGLVIFIDPAVNSMRVIMENVYHLLLLTAFRFHSYIQALPLQLKRLYNAGQLLVIIMEIGSSFYFKALATVRRLPEKLHLPMDINAVKWLCVKAFDVKLSRHLGAHKELVVKLREKRKTLSRRLDNGKRFHLAEASTPDIPGPFYKTRF